MKTASIVFNRDNLLGAVTALLDALEPADLVRLEQQCQRIEEFRAFVARRILVLPDNPFAATGRTPIDAAELNDLERHVMALEERFDAGFQSLTELTERMADEIAGLHKLAVGQADRIAAQSEMLARRAERAEAAAGPAGTMPPPEFGAGVVPAPVAEQFVERVRREAEQVQTQPGEAIAIVVTSTVIPAEPSANGHAQPPIAACHTRRLEIAKLLVSGPRSPKDIYTALSIPKGSICELLAHPWFTKTDRADGRAPYKITDTGRTALAEVGYVLVPSAKAASTAEPEAPAACTLDPKARAIEQCRLIAAAIVEAGAEPLTLDAIARKAGLPPDVTQKRLARFGPSSNYGIRYFCKSEKHAGCWRVTNSGEALAKEGRE